MWQLFRWITDCHVAALLAIDTYSHTTINESTRRGWPTDFPPVCSFDGAHSGTSRTPSPTTLLRLKLLLAPPPPLQ